MNDFNLEPIDVVLDDDENIEYEMGDDGEPLLNDDGEKIPKGRKMYSADDVEKTIQELQAKAKKLEEDNRIKDENFRKLRGKVSERDDEEDDKKQDKPEIDIESRVSEVAKQQYKKIQLETTLDDKLKNQFGNDKDKKDLVRNFFNNLYDEKSNMDVDTVFEQSVRAAGFNTSKANYSSGGEVGGGTGTKSPEKERSKHYKAVKNILERKNQKSDFGKGRVIK